MGTHKELFWWEEIPNKTDAELKMFPLYKLIDDLKDSITYDQEAIQHKLKSLDRVIGILNDKL